MECTVKLTFSNFKSKKKYILRYRSIEVFHYFYKQGNKSKYILSNKQMKLWHLLNIWFKSLAALRITQSNVSNFCLENRIITINFKSRL